mgnify:CR=1 FL=1
MAIECRAISGIDEYAINSRENRLFGNKIFDLL